MTPLFGHDAAVAAFRESMDSGRLHHAWLISGPEGVGKSVFAHQAAQRLLAGATGLLPGNTGLLVEPSHPTARLLSAGTHPDFKLVKREVWAGTRPNDYIVPEDDRSASDQPARSIRVKQIRMLSLTLQTRPSMSEKRAIVIDLAEDMEVEASNALLKMLEEPPSGTVFFLVSHASERLLPTIRSRCRQIRLSYLDDNAMASALAAALPDADDLEIEALKAAGKGSPGRAIAFRGLDVDGLDRTMRELATGGDPSNVRRAELASSLALKSAQPRYEAFLACAPSFIAAAARTRSGPALAEALKLWERATDLAGGATRLSLDPQSVVFELSGMIAALARGR